MSGRERADIELGILSIGREWDKQSCQCDPDVGMVPCHYCAEHAAILAGERLLQQLTAAQSLLREACLALRQIAYPIDWLREQAEIENKRIDGMMACHLAEDANYLRCIAEKAYEAARAAGGGK